MKSPLAGMGAGQKIATVALGLLALIFLLALVSRGHSGSPASSSPTAFTPASYGASGGPSTSSPGARSTRSASPTADGLRHVRLGDLPKEAQETAALVQKGGPYPYPRDGVVYNNYNRVLPQHPRGWYHEFTVKTPGASGRGARRIVSGKDDTMYYTDDHYDSFETVVP